ncbi:MAG TPA: tryptophan--tRNA ligase [Pantanalinema sp.]
MSKKRIMSGMRPTGQLHLGHWLGVLVNWEKLQDAYDCYFMVADWHALTTGFEKTEHLRANTREVLLDWLAAGIDPARSTIYVQSSLPEIAELTLLLSMITPVSWLQRNPTVKEQAAELHAAEDAMTSGWLNYPTLMSADILAFKGELVPVGKDQLPHLEISRDMARRFNHLYAEVFPEPKGLLTEESALPGLDGRKMSKSYHNDIKLADTPEATQQKVMTMVTDPGRQRRQDPGYPEVCTVYGYYNAIAPDLVPQVAAECRTASIGCVQCKRRLADSLNATLAPIRERREAYAQTPGLLETILQEGKEKAAVVARETMAEVREAMKLNVLTPAFAENPR